MKKALLALTLLFFILTSSLAQYKKDGTPDMRYKANKETYGTSYSTPNYTNPSTKYQKGYVKTNGTYVTPHYKTKKNSTNHDNFSTEDNYNTYNGKSGSRAKDYSNNAYNYGQGKTIYKGSRGGQYYYNDNGKKVYVPKRN